MTENTLRDQFAMAALTGLVAARTSVSTSNADPHKTFAIASYAVADAMLAERARQKPKANEGAEK